MRIVPLWLLLAPALVLSGCHKASDHAGKASVEAVDPAAPAGGWAAQVVATPEGGIRMGNPHAKAMLVEYASYTCPHCAKFDTEAMPTIRQDVAAGRLSYELRSFIRDPFDLSAALVARCGGPAGFFSRSDQIFAAQQEWIGNAQNMTQADAKKIDALPPAEQLYQITRVTGLNGFTGQGGVDSDGLHQCLTDQAAWNRLIQGTQAAGKTYKIDGTPTFILNGKVIGSPDWQELKPILAAAVGG